MPSTATGTVLDPENHPVVGARVEFGDDIPPVFTDAQGKFSAQFPLPQISYIIVDYRVPFLVSAPGYALTGGLLDDNKPAECTLTKPVALHGIVIDAHDLPVTGIPLALEGLMLNSHQGIMPSKELSARFRAVSDTQGQFTIDGLANGCQVYVLADDPRYAKFHVLLLIDPAATNTITMTPGATIRGRVVNIDKKPLPHIRVTAFTSKSSFMETESADDGSFTISRLHAGDCNVFAGDSAKQWICLKKPESLTLNAGKTYNVGTLTMARGGTIKVTVVDNAGKPLAKSQGNLSCSQISPALARYVPTPDDIMGSGGSEIREQNGTIAYLVLPGEYDVNVVPPAGYTATTPTHKSFTVKPGTTTQFTVRCTMKSKLPKVGGR